MIRKMCVAGSFYPSDPKEIVEMISRYNTILKTNTKATEQIERLSGRYFIVPHAGWVYSGFTANIAYQIASHTPILSVVVIGPSHRIGFEGISISQANEYQTPLGNMMMDSDLIRDLREKFHLKTVEQAHCEHSTEVQMPFIKRYIKDAKVVELVYSRTDPSILSGIIDYLDTLPDIAVMISTDLSHYYGLDEAKKLDAICLGAIQNENTAMLHQGCEACGKIGVEAMILSAKKHNLEAVLLDYRTSADAFGDSSRVVGYASALFR